MREHDYFWDIGRIGLARKKSFFKGRKTLREIISLISLSRYTVNMYCCFNPIILPLRFHWKKSASGRMNIFDEDRKNGADENCHKTSLTFVNRDHSRFRYKFKKIWCSLYSTTKPNERMYFLWKNLRKQNMKSKFSVMFLYDVRTSTYYKI
jgi:hypothetical protein